jgi:hypothetical protein
VKSSLRHSWIVLIALLAWQPAAAAEFYVHPDGNDADPGTLAQPFAPVARAQETVAPGDAVWIRGGTCVFSGTKIEIGILPAKSGAEGTRINYWAYRDETPVFDFHQLATPVRIRGISVKADWLHLRGLELRGAQQILTNTNESWGFCVEGGSRFCLTTKCSRPTRVIFGTGCGVSPSTCRAT